MGRSGPAAVFLSSLLSQVLRDCLIQPVASPPYRTTTYLSLSENATKTHLWRELPLLLEATVGIACIRIQVRDAACDIHDVIMSDRLM